MFSLPYPPSINSYWRHRIFGRRAVVYVTNDGKDYREAVKRTISVNAPLHGDLSVDVLLYPPDRRKRDLDNPIKGLLDAITHAGVWGDDSQVKKIQVQMMPELGGRAVVSITGGHYGGSNTTGREGASNG